MEEGGDQGAVAERLREEIENLGGLNDGGPGFKMTYLHMGVDKLGESPLWHPVHQKFFWVDVWNCKIWSLEMPKDGSSPTDGDI